MARSSGFIIAALGLVLGFAVPAAQSAERGLSYIVPVAAGSTDSVAAGRQPMPALLLADGSAMPLNLGRFAGRVLVLNFWSMGCGPCLKEMVFLNRLQGDLATLPLLVLAANEDPIGIPAVKTFLTQQKDTFLKPFSDPGGAAALALNVRGIPSSVIIDKHGRVVQMVEGPLEWDRPEILAQFRKLLAEN